MAGARRRAAGPLGAGRAGGDPGVPAPGASDLSGERGAAQVTRPGLRAPVSTPGPPPRPSNGPAQGWGPGTPTGRPLRGGLDVNRARSGGGARRRGEPGVSAG